MRYVDEFFCLVKIWGFEDPKSQIFIVGKTILSKLQKFGHLWNPQKNSCWNLWMPKKGMIWGFKKYPDYIFIYYDETIIYF